MTSDRGALLKAILADHGRVQELSVTEALVLLAEAAAIQVTLAARIAAQQQPTRGSSREPRVEADRLLSPDEAAARLGVTRKWLYRHAKQLPFARKLSLKALRFSEVGLQKYLASRQG